MLAKMKALATPLVLCLVVAAYGFPEGQIVGGRDAPVGKFPYQISLRQNGYHFCGGSIINSRYILTAAHCVDGLDDFTSLSIHAGTTLLNASGEVYKIEKIAINRDWGLDGLLNDVALIRVDKDIAFNNLVQPIKLASGTKPYEGSSCVLSGWGSTRLGAASPPHLQYINLRVENQEKCVQFHPDVKSSQICTYTKAGEGACQGDSGGPLVADGLQIGIVSYGTPCAAGEPDVYTRVSSFVSWINDQQANLMNENAEEPIDAIYIA